MGKTGFEGLENRLCTQQILRCRQFNEIVKLICVEVKDARAVKRTVSIPKWMDDKVVQSGLSLSRVLQDALNEKLA